MDEVLREALAPVWRDLRSTGIHAPRVEVPGWSEDPTYASAKLWSPDGSGSGVGVSREAPAHERIATAAEQVQDWVIDELWGQGATNWPPCPRHPHSHPMTVRTRDGSAVWTCPADEVVVAPVGGL